MGILYKHCYEYRAMKLTNGWVSFLDCLLEAVPFFDLADIAKANDIIDTARCLPLSNPSDPFIVENYSKFLDALSRFRSACNARKSFLYREVPPPPFKDKIFTLGMSPDQKKRATEENNRLSQEWEIEFETRINDWVKRENENHTDEILRIASNDPLEAAPRGY